MPRFAARGKGVFFERSGQSTRELWFAVPIRGTQERYPAWRAVPLLRPKAPARIGEVVSLRDDNTIFMASGTARPDKETGSGLDTQLFLVGVQNSRVLRTLWSGRERLGQLSPSPDATTVVFTRYFRDGRGREMPQLWRIDAEGAQKPKLVFKNARRALWLDSSTLVFERLVAQGTQFCALNPFVGGKPRLLLQGSGEGAALGGGDELVFSAQGLGATVPSLYLLGRDGSGLQIVPDTLGARHPNVSGDGERLAYDALNPQTGARGIWFADLDAPVATPTLVSQASVPPRAEACPLEPMPLPPPAETSNVSPSTSSPPDTPDSALDPVPDITPMLALSPVPTPAQGAQTSSDDKADIDVAGTLATMTAGGKTRVTFWAKNRGKRNWTPDDVRIVVRWVDFETGARRKWSFNWMRGVVPPLGQVRIPIDIVAPGKAGRYKIIYSLIRLPSKGAQVKPPAYDSSQDGWPGEFAATAFAVNVKEP